MIGRYAVLNGIQVTNIVLADSVIAQQQGWVAAPANIGPAATFANGVWTPAVPDPLMLNQAAIERAIANALPALRQILAADPTKVTLPQVAQGRELVVEVM